MGYRRGLERRIAIMDLIRKGMEETLVGTFAIPTQDLVCYLKYFCNSLEHKQPQYSGLYKPGLACID